MLLEITSYFSMIFVLDEEDLEDRLQFTTTCAISAYHH
jgi:hypothetical protein